MKKVVVSAKGLITKNQRLLFLKETFGKNNFVWDLPGGKIQFGETPEKTLAREIKEEIGVHVAVKELLGVFYFFGVMPQNKNTQTICLVYKCQPSDLNFDFTKNPAKDEHIVETDWFTSGEILSKKFVCATNLKSFIRQV